MNLIIDFAFKGRTQSKISINNFGIARWCNASKYFCFDKNSLKEAVCYLINNCYFVIGTFTFRQAIGIPMGSDPAPFFANLFLSYFEWQYMKNLNKENNILAHKFNYTFRYIDDLITINSLDHFDKSIEKIYPTELKLKNKSSSSYEATFLDLHIKVENSRFSTRLYDKRDDFNFHVVRMPFKNSLMPTKMFESSINAEILRVCKATTEYCQFVQSVRALIKRMENQGANT